MEVLLLEVVLVWGTSVPLACWIQRRTQVELFSGAQACITAFRAVERVVAREMWTNPSKELAFVAGFVEEVEGGTFTGVRGVGEGGGLCGLGV